MIKVAFVIIGLMVLSGCNTFSPPHYFSEKENVIGLQKINISDISLASFTGPTKFDDACRAVGKISPDQNTTFADYIQEAFAEELKQAGLYSNKKPPRFTLTGRINSLSFSTTKGIYGGVWDIDLTLNSSNGQSMSISEHLEFQGDFNPMIACNRTIEAFPMLVRNLIGNIVYSSEFKTLIT